jgi:hypothetical protein
MLKFAAFTRVNKHKLCGISALRAFFCSGKINLEYLGSTSDEYVFGNRIVETVKPQSGEQQRQCCRGRN